LSGDVVQLLQAPADPFDRQFSKFVHVVVGQFPENRKRYFHFPDTGGEGFVLECIQE
jgi:hypothetical protein